MCHVALREITVQYEVNFLVKYSKFFHDWGMIQNFEYYWHLLLVLLACSLELHVNLHTNIKQKTMLVTTDKQ